MNIITRLRILWNAFVRNDETARLAVAERVCRLIYPQHKFSDWGRTYLHDEEFLRYYRRFDRSGKYRSLDRKYALDQLVQLVAGVEGDSAECGVFEGASSYLICRQLSRTGKLHHLFDSFEGLSEPSQEDGIHWRRGNMSAGEELVQSNLKEFEFVRYHKGWIPERFADVADRRFCFVHVDVDLHDPTRESVAFFYERLNAGGLLVCDDYGFAKCPGATRALDDFLVDKSEPLVMLPTGQAFFIKGTSGRSAMRDLSAGRAA